MLRDDYIRYHAIEMMQQLNYLDDNDKLDHLDELISMLQARRDKLRYVSKSNDLYEVKPIGGYYVVYKNGVRQKGHYVSEKEAYESCPED